MATKKIWELPAASTLNDTDVIVIDDGSNNYKIPWGTVKGLLGSVSAFEADPDQTTYPGRLRLTLANGTVLRAYCADPAKQNLLTFDNTPTANSSNPVKSGGVKSALDLKLDSADYVNFTGAGDQNPGTAGKVPAPAAGGERYLSSSGAWTAPDAQPTAGSAKPVSSGGVRDAIDESAPGVNLADNWWFGTGVVNQRGKTSYTSGGYFIDRWRIVISTGASVSAVLGSDGITFSNSGTGRYTLIGYFKPMSDRDYTLSVLCSGIIGAPSWQARYTDGSWKSTETLAAGVSTLQLTKAVDYVDIYVPAGASVKIHAVKLEPGTRSTLARNVGTEEIPVWRLCDPLPDPALELLKCQRYFQIFRTEALRPTYGPDFRPPMATAEPTLASGLVIDGVSYFTASSERS